MAHEHDYRKLNEAAVFCRGCGDIKIAEPPVCTLPHYPTYPYVPPIIYPTVPWWSPSYPTWIVSTGTTTVGTIDVSNTTSLPDGTSVTYTAENIS